MQGRRTAGASPKGRQKRTSAAATLLHPAPAGFSPALARTATRSSPALPALLAAPSPPGPRIFVPRPARLTPESTTPRRHRPHPRTSGIDVQENQQPPRHRLSPLVQATLDRK